MTAVVNVHWLAGRNVGDHASGPGRYLWWGRVPELHMDGPWPAGAIVIIGGGGLCHPDLSAIVARRLAESRPRAVVVWGVGANTHGRTGIDGYPEWVDRARLAGLRDWLPGRGRRWVPCASCLSPAFDRAIAIEPQHEVVGYWHHEVPVPVAGIAPALTNACESLPQAAAFMASGETVLTNTYHGAYWATLLGRRVVIVEPFSNRFLGLRHAPQICAAADWCRAVSAARSYPEALDQCREANLRFADEVEELTESGALPRTPPRDRGPSDSPMQGTPADTEGVGMASDSASPARPAIDASTRGNGLGRSAASAAGVLPDGRMSGGARLDRGVRGASLVPRLPEAVSIPAGHTDLTGTRDWGCP